MSYIINFSEGYLIAIHALWTLHENKEAKLLSVQDIAKLLSSSEAHLAKIMQKLVRYELLTSTRGPRGGFKLLKDISDISLMDLYLIVEGPIGDLSCDSRSVYCTSACSLKVFKNNINQQILEYLNNTSIEDIVNSNR